jgi:hypothetical protein
VAESSWPSPSNSRLVGDDQYEKVALSYGPTGGVVGGFTSPQLVYGDSTGMQVKVAADRYALVRGHEWWSGSTIFTAAIGANASGSTRIDLVVLRLSRTTWDVNLTVIAGTPGSGAPSPVQNVGTTGSFDLPLALVTVASGASTVSAANVNYIATHLLADGGGYLVPSAAALAYVPVPGVGQQATTTDGFRYAHDGSSFLPGPKAIGCRATQGTVQSGWTTGTYNSITFGTEDFDWGGIHDPVTNSSRINIGLYLGLWEITGMYCAAVNANVSNHRVHLTMNGTAINGALGSYAFSGTTGFVCVPLPPTLVVATSPSDYVELQGYMVAPSGTIGTASSTEARCSFQAIHRGHQ